MGVPQFQVLRRALTETLPNSRYLLRKRIEVEGYQIRTFVFDGKLSFIYRGVLAIFFAYLPMSAMLGALNLRTNVVCKWNLCSF